MAKEYRAVRIGEDVQERLDALVPKLSTAWHEATRSDVLRAVLMRGLPLVEKDHKVKLPVSMADSMKGASK